MEDILNREQELEKKNAKLLEKETAYQKKSEQLELDLIQLDLKAQDLAREIDLIKEEKAIFKAKKIKFEKKHNI